MSEKMQADMTLDCRGMLCPMPVVKTAMAMKQMEIGQVLEMVATDPGSPPDIAAWAEQTQNELIDSKQAGDEYIFQIRRVK